MDVQTSLRLLSGLLALIAGAELLVRGAARIAAGLGISSLVIGLTVVAFGTSSPELAVSLGAALAGRTDLAVGNVVGSNVFNVLAILGLSAMVTPLVVAAQLVRLDVPVMIGVSILLLVMAADGAITRLDGIWLVLGMVAYTVFAVYEGRAEAGGAGAQAVRPPLRALDSLLVVGGLVLLVYGARWLVDGATGLARALGVSDAVVGLTIVAAGTSLPEAATSIVAALRGQRDIAVGNVVGSNILNVLAILGLTAAVAGTLPVPAALRAFDLPVMLAVALACLPVFATGHLIARWEGALFFAYYVVYTLYVVLASVQHDSLEALSNVMLAFVLPLTTITLVVVFARAARARR